MIIVLDDNFPVSQYNTVAYHPLQAWEWGEARIATGVSLVRIGEFKKDHLTNVFQMTIHQIPYSNFKIGYLPRSVFPSDEVVNFLFDYGKKNNIIFVKIEPYVEKNSKLKIQNSKLLQSNHPLFPAWTQVIDLTKSEDELLKSFHPKTRYNIRLAQKKGVVVSEMSNEKGFGIFSRLYFETCKRQKYFGHTPEYHQIIWNSLKKNISHILIAFYENTPLAAYELFHFKNILYYPYGGTSLAYRNLMASNLLMWEAIRLGKKLGAEKFDLWGSLAQNYDEKNAWAGFTRFKEGYGTKFVEFTGSYDLVIRPALYRLYTLSDKIRESYLRARRFF